MRTSPLRLAFATMVLLLMVPCLPPASAADTISIDRFNGDVTEATLDFKYSLTNSTLSVDIPPGAHVERAELVVEGVGVNGSPESTLDFAKGVLDTNVWAYSKEGQGIYPPAVDPRNHQWTKIGNSDVKLIKAIDSEIWTLQTTGQGMPPYEWPIQLYRFAPSVAGATSMRVMWHGMGLAALNATGQYQAEVWLYDHTDQEWVRVVKRIDSNTTAQWLNHTFDLPSPYLALDGSVDVAVAGPHSDNQLIVNVPGIITTDYIAVNVTGVGDLQYPADVALSVDGVGLATVMGNVTDPVTIGDAQDLASNLQTVLDGYKVTPDNVTLVFDFSVGFPTAGMLRVSGLLIEYTPLTNLAPIYNGPASVEVMEDSDWTKVINLDDVFEDDFNRGELELSIDDIEWPGLSLALFRIIRDAGGNRSLEVRPVTDVFGDLPVTLTVRARDAFGLEALAHVNVTVLQKPDPPVLDEVGTLEAHERAPIRYTVTVSDVDLPDDEFTFSDDSDLVTIDPVTGEFSWTPSPEDIGTHVFHVTVTDRFGLTDRIDVTIVVENSNDPPVITSGDRLETQQDQETTYTIQVYDPDVPFGDVVSFSAFADAVDVLVDDDTGVVTFTPTNGQIPSFEITIQVHDLIGASDEIVLIVDVENVNDPPAFGAFGDLTYDQNEEVAFKLPVDDPDLSLGPPLTDVLTFTGAGPNKFLPDSEGWVRFVAGQADVGSHAVTYTTRDIAGLTDVVTVTWTIVDVNDPPVIVNTLPGTLDEDEAFTLTMLAMDLDDDTLSWSDNTDLFDIDGATGEINFTPTQADVGTHSMTITVSDGHGGEARSTITLEVLNVNDPPVIASALVEGGPVFQMGEAIKLSATATDEDGDALTYVWKAGGKELGVGPSITVDDLGKGKHTIVLEVKDPSGASDTHELAVEVEGSLASDLMLPIAILVIIVVVVAIVLVARSRSRRAEEPEEEPQAEGAPAEEAPTSSGEEVVLSYDMESTTLLDMSTLSEAPEGDVPEEEGDAEVALVHTPGEEHLYNLEDAEEYKVDNAAEGDPEE